MCVDEPFRVRDGMRVECVRSHTVILTETRPLLKQSSAEPAQRLLADFGATRRRCAPDELTGAVATLG